MDVKTALETVVNGYDDRQGFVETFDPSDWGEDDRFDDHGETEAFDVLAAFTRRYWVVSSGLYASTIQRFEDLGEAQAAARRSAQENETFPFPVVLDVVNDCEVAWEEDES